MSKSADMVWEVSDMRSILGTYELDEDFFRGLNEAVYNGQTRLALEYSARIGQLINHVMELEGRLDVLEAAETPKPAKASTAKSRKIYKGSEEVTEQPDPSQDQSSDE